MTDEPITLDEAHCNFIIMKKSLKKAEDTITYYCNTFKYFRGFF